MRLELFDAHLHDVQRFDSGQPELDRWLKRFAKRSQRDSLTRIHVLVPDGEEGKRPVVGFFALSMASVSVAALPEAERARLPRYPVPAVLLTRLAIATTHQGRGLGKALVYKAAQKALLANRAVAARLLIVDALDERAAAFYRSFGFAPFPADSLRLAISLDRLAIRLHRRPGTPE